MRTERRGRNAAKQKANRQTASLIDQQRDARNAAVPTGGSGGGGNGNGNGSQRMRRPSVKSSLKGLAEFTNATHRDDRYLPPAAFYGV